MAKNQSTKGNFVYNNIEKIGKNFMYMNLERSNCYNCDFSKSGFDYVSFRGAHFKSCNFFRGTFKWAEFTGSNLKGSIFREALFENTIFNSVNLEGVNFKDAEFKNTIFIATDVTKAKNLNPQHPGIKIYDELPEFEISDVLRNSVENLLNNKFIKHSRVLDTKDGGINLLSIMILLENFDEDTLIKGLEIFETQVDRDFHTLSYIIRFLGNCKANGTL